MWDSFMAKLLKGAPAFQDTMKVVAAITCAVLLGAVTSAHGRISMRCRVTVPKEDGKRRLNPHQTGNRKQSATRWHMGCFRGIVSRFEPRTSRGGASFWPAALRPRPQE